MPRTRDNKLAEDRRKRKQSGVGAKKARALGNPRAKPPHRENMDRPTPTTDLRK